jgi:hypothetical protein
MCLPLTYSSFLESLVHPPPPTCPERVLVLYCMGLTYTISKFKKPVPKVRYYPSDDGEVIISYLCNYDLYGPVRNVIDACRSITRASGRGLGSGNREFFEPFEMTSSRNRRVPFGAQKTVCDICSVRSVVL